MSIEIELLLFNTDFISFDDSKKQHLFQQHIVNQLDTADFFCGQDIFIFFFFFIPEQIRNYDSGSQRVEWQRTWACRNRELAGDSFHRVLVTLISAICSMNERRVSVNIFVQKKREERVVVLEDRSKSNGQRVLLFHFIFFVFFSFFPLISGYMDRFEFLFRVSRYSSYVMQKQNTADVKVSHAICLFSISYRMTIM